MQKVDAMENNLIGEEIALELLKIKAVFLRPKEPFTWASGIKSPIYCDNRLILTSPKVRDKVEEGLKNIIEREYEGVESIFATATAGIAHGAIVADKMNLPMGYVRSSSKGHGRQNKIEGKLEKGTKVVVIEDLISTGGSVIEVVDALREAGAEVLGVASIFTYGMTKSKERLKESNLKNFSLTNFDEVIKVAVKTGYIESQDEAKLLEFRKNPSDESWIK